MVYVFNASSSSFFFPYVIMKVYNHVGILSYLITYIISSLVAIKQIIAWSL